MDTEVFAGRPEAEFGAVVERLRAEGRTVEADQVAYLYASWLASHGRLSSTPPPPAAGSPMPPA